MAARPLPLHAVPLRTRDELPCGSWEILRTHLGYVVAALLGTPASYRPFPWRNSCSALPTRLRCFEPPSLPSCWRGPSGRISPCCVRFGAIRRGTLYPSASITKTRPHRLESRESTGAGLLRLAWRRSCARTRNANRLLSAHTRRYLVPDLSLTRRRIALSAVMKGGGPSSAMHLPCSSLSASSPPTAFLR